MFGFVTNSVPVNVIGSDTPSTVTVSFTETGKFPVRKPESPTAKVPVCNVKRTFNVAVTELVVSESESAEGLNVCVAVPVKETMPAEAGRVISPKLKSK